MGFLGLWGHIFGFWARYRPAGLVGLRMVICLSRLPGLDPGSILFFGAPFRANGFRIKSGMTLLRRNDVVLPQ